MAVKLEDLQGVDLNAGVDITAEDLAGVDLSSGVNLTSNKLQDFKTDILNLPVVGTLARGAGEVLKSPYVERSLDWLGTAADYLAAAPIRAMIGASAQGGGPLEEIKAGLSQYLKAPSTAPTGTELAQMYNVPETPASQYFPQAFSETGEGLPLKIGSYMDISPRDLAALGFNLLDPSILVGGELARLPAATAKGGFKVGSGVGKAVAGEEKFAKAKSFVEPFKEKAGEFAELFGGPEFKAAPTFEKQMRVVKSNGIDPELINASVKYGPESSLAKYEKSLAEGTGPKADELVRKNELLHNQIKSSIDKNTAALSGSGYISLDFASEGLRNKFASNIKDAVNSVDSRYESALDQFGNIQIGAEAKKPLDDVLNSMESKIKKQMALVSPQRKVAYKNMLDDIQSYRDASVNYEDLLTSMRMINENAFKKDNIFEYGDMEKISGAMRKTLLNAVPDKELRKSIEESNRYLSDVFSARDKLKGIIGNENLSPMDVFDRVFTRGTAEQIKAVKMLYTPEDFAKFRSVYLREHVLGPVYKTMLPEGGQEVSSGYRQSRNIMMDRRNREKLGLMFQTGELKNIMDLLNLGDKAGTPYMSKSRTGTSLGARLGDFVGQAVGVIPEALKRKNLTAADIELNKTYGFSPQPQKGLFNMSGVDIPPFVRQAANISAQQAGRMGMLYGEEQR